MIRVKDWKAMYGAIDITDEPILNWTSTDWKRILVPTLIEKMKDKTRVMTEVDDDVCYYIPIYKWEPVWYCNNKKEAQNILDEYEQRDYDIQEAKRDLDGNFIF